MSADGDKPFVAGYSAKSAILLAQRGVVLRPKNPEYGIGQGRHSS